MRRYQDWLMSASQKFSSSSMALGCPKIFGWLPIRTTDAILGTHVGIQGRSYQYVKCGN